MDNISVHGTENLVTADNPFHPPVNIIRPQSIENKNGNKRILHFQSQWFDMYPWLHYSVGKKSQYCVLFVQEPRR